MSVTDTYAMSHLSAEACTQRLAAGRVDGYRLAAGQTCCASCGSSGEATSIIITPRTRWNEQNEYNFNFKCTVISTNSRLWDRTFAAAGPRLWNSLPTHVRRCYSSLDIFHRKLKRI